MSGGMRPGPDIFGSLLHGVQKVAWELWGEQEPGRLQPIGLQSVRHN